MDWKPISDIPGYEEFTNFKLNIQGELRNVKTGNTLEWLENQKYLRANLKQAPAEKHITQHRAICCLFKPNPLNLPYIDHKDRDTSNNNIENLRWVTPLENVHNQGVRTNNTTGERNIYAIYKDGKPVWRITMMFKGKERSKTFKRDPTSDEIPQEVKDFRDAMKLEIQVKLQTE